MKKLTLHLAAPLASFGTGMRLQHRHTDQLPTRSAVIGMIACAMGRERGADCADLESLGIELEIQTHSPRAIDFQTVRGGVTYDGKPNRAIITERHFLQDYHARVEVTGEDGLIDSVEQALRFPRWQLYVGRRAHVLSGPVVRGAATMAP